MSNRIPLLDAESLARIGQHALQVQAGKSGLLDDTHAQVLVAGRVLPGGRNG